VAADVPAIEAPDFTLPDSQGRPWSLGEHLCAGPVLLIFYRGDW
jgi:peroxiredoxin